MAQEQDMLELVQNRTLEKLQKDGVMQATDPTTWINIMLALTELFLDCRKKRSTQEIISSIKNPNMVQKLRLRRALIKHVGRSKLRAMRNEDTLPGALLQVAAAAKDEEVGQLLEQVYKG